MNNDQKEVIRNLFQLMNRTYSEIESWEGEYDFTEDEQYALGNICESILVSQEAITEAFRTFDS